MNWLYCVAIRLHKPINLKSGKWECYLMFLPCIIDFRWVVHALWKLHFGNDASHFSKNQLFLPVLKRAWRDCDGKAFLSCWWCQRERHKVGEDWRWRDNSLKWCYCLIWKLFISSFIRVTNGAYPSLQFPWPFACDCISNA